MPQLSDVLTQFTPDQWLGVLLQACQNASLNAQGWQAKRIARVLLEVEADVDNTFQGIVINIANGGYLNTATGVWLDLLGIGWFQNPRNSPLATIIQLTLTDTANAGPYTLANPVAVAYPSAQNPLYYRSVAGTVTVPRGGSVQASFVAQSTGQVYNVSPGQITDLATPIPGVSVTSPQIGTTGVITIQAGQDAELDAAYAARLQNQWGLLSVGFTAAKIIALTGQALPGRTLRCVVLDPGPVPGVAYEYIADASGPISAADALNVYTYLAAPIRKPVGNWPVQTYPCTSYVKAISWTLYLDGSTPSALADCEARLTAYQSTLNPGAVVHVSRLIDVAVNGATDGVIGAVPTNLTGVEFLSLGRTDVLEMVPTFATVGP